MTGELSAVSNIGPNTGHVWYAYRTRPEIPDLLPNTSGMLNSKNDFGRKIKNPSKWHPKIMKF
jgi:hypothetical protein